MKNDGTSTQKLFEDLMKARGYHVFRLRDKKDVMGLNRGKRVAMFPCPADYLVAGGGSLELVEVKSTQNETRFDYGDIRPAQRSAACICAAVGSPYYFFIYSITTKKAYSLDAKEFAEDLKAGKKSRKFEDMVCLQM